MSEWGAWYWNFGTGWTEEPAKEKPEPRIDEFYWCPECQDVTGHIVFPTAKMVVCIKCKGGPCARDAHTATHSKPEG